MSAFTSAKVDRIRELQPDLVLGFSDLQADIAAELVRLGLNVHVFNHRDVAGILQHDPRARRHDRLRGEGGRAGDAARARISSEVRAAAAALRSAAARVLRGMGRADDLRHPLGVGADRHRGRRGLFRRQRAARRSARIASSPIRSRSCGARRTSFSAHGAARSSGPDAVAARPGWETRAGGRAAPAARDQVIDHPAARTRGADRRRARDSRTSMAEWQRAVRLQRLARLTSVK